MVGEQSEGGLKSHAGVAVLPTSNAGMEDVMVSDVSSEQLLALRHRHLLGLATYAGDEIQLILDTAREFREVLERPI